MNRTIEHAEARIRQLESLLAIEQEKSRAVARECGRLADEAEKLRLDVLRVEGELDRLRAALAVFADPENWDTGEWWIADTDPIDFARRALEGKP